MSLAYDTRETERTDFVAVLAKVCLVTFLISLGMGGATPSVLA